MFQQAKSNINIPKQSNAKKCEQLFFSVKKYVWRAKKMVGNISEHFCWEQDPTEGCL